MQNRREDVPLNQMQIDRLDRDRGEVIVNIIPRGDSHWRITVYQRQRFIQGGWATTISWNGGGDLNDPDAFLEAFQKAIQIRDELRTIHPDGSLEA